MSSSRRDNNFTKSQVKGVDMCVRAAAKKYKFIKGWRLDDRFEEYNTFLYIDLFVDWFEISEYMDLKINPFYLNYYKNHEDFKAGALGSHMLLKNMESVFDLTDDARQKISDDSFKLNRQIYNTLNAFYKQLPETHQIFYKVGIDTPFEDKELVDLSVDEYVQYKSFNHE